MRIRGLFLILISASLLTAQLTQPITCATQSPTVPNVRSGAVRDLIAELIIQCTGGTPGPAIIANFQFTLNTPATSRLLQPQNNATEALLLIDDPGPAAQLAQPAGTFVPGANVIQGVRAGTNSIAFLNVPFTPPGSGVRILRLVNMRADVTALQQASVVTLLMSATSSVQLLITNPSQPVASVGPPSSFSARTIDDANTFAVNIDGCPGRNPIVTESTLRDFNLRFTEGSATDFKKRNIATSAANPVGVADQNLPGNSFGTESGFLNTGFTNLNGLNEAGLATQGARLMARFINVPAGVNVFVTTTPVQPGTSATPIDARLVQTDANGAGPFTFPTPTAGPYVRLPVIGGAATAVWEILDSNLTILESVSFGVVLSVPSLFQGAGQISVSGQLAPVLPSGIPGVSSPAPGFQHSQTAIPVALVQACLAPLTILTACPLASGTLNTAYNTSLSATGGTLPYTWSLAFGVLPPGLALSQAGVIAGIPALQGTYPITLRVTDAVGSTAIRECSIQVVSPVAITTPCPLPEGLLGLNYALILTATGGTPPYAWALLQGSLPQGMSLTPNGSLVGAPANQGIFNFTLVARDQFGAIASRECALRIGVPFVVEPSTMQFTLPSGQVSAAPQLISVTRDSVGATFSVRSTTTSGGDWLNATALSPLIPGLVEVTASAAGLSPGTYFGTVIVFTQGGAVQQSNTVAVTLIVQQASAPTTQGDPIMVALPRGSGQRLRTIALPQRSPQARTFTAAIEFINGLNWLTVTPPSGPIPPNATLYLRAAFQPGALDPGTYRARVRVQATQPLEERIFPVALSVSQGREALALSHNGLSFTSVFLSSPPSPQTFHVLSTGAGAFNWTASTSVDPGLPSWLSLSAASGSASPGNPSAVEVRINPAGLSPGRHFGEVLVRADGVDNSPRILYVALNVLANNVNPGLDFQPSGLLFLGGSTRPAPAAQSFSLLNPSNLTVRYDFLLNGEARVWTIAGPQDRVLAPGASANFTVTPSIAGLAPGAHRATINFQAAGDPRVRQMQLLLIVAAQAPRTASIQRTADAVCPPGGVQLVPLRQAIGFGAATGIPLAVDVRASATIDGSPLTSGLVAASLAGAASSTINLVHIDSDPGRWSGTLLPPASATAALALRLFAEDPARGITGCLDLSGSLESTGAPVISDGGVVSTASFAGGVPVSPGGMAAIFGSRLADGSSSASALPLPAQLGTTRVSISGRILPLFFAGDLTTFSQVNGILPYGLTPNVSHQISLRRGGLPSFAEILLAEAQPGLFSVAQSGAGQGVIVHGANPLLIADTANPIGRGEAIVIYCEGLGPVDPPLDAGQQTPASPLRRTTLPIQVLIGGQPAEILFSGLTPGLSGLYQINAVVPPGAVSGNSVTVVVTIGGLPSNTVTIAIRP